MASKPTAIYSGPKAFAAPSLAVLAALLDRAFLAVDRAVRSLGSGTQRRWTYGDTIRGNATLKPSVALEVDTLSAPGNAVALTLAPFDTADIGLDCGIVRLSAAGTITLFPVDGATLNGSTASAAIPATAGFYVVSISPRGYWLRR